MLTNRFVVLLSGFHLLLLGAGTACGQNYPHKPIRIIPGEAGGATDLIVRLIAPGLVSSLGQPVVVENRSSRIAVEIVVKAPPDGYTLLLNGPVVWLAQFLQDHVSWEPLRDFSPVTLVSNGPNILVVHPSVPAKTVKELIALAKAKPGELNYAAGVIGTPPHLAAELFKSMAGIDIVRINYKGAAPALLGMIGGQAQLMFPSAGAAAPHVKSGRVRALAVASAQPSELAPGLPTVAASGLPGYEAVTMLGIFAPAKTPAAIINRLNREIARLVNEPDIKEKLFASGVEAVSSSPEQFAAAIKADMDRMGKLIKEKGIRAE